jgi:hypothetical protein
MTIIEDFVIKFMKNGDGFMLKFQCLHINQQQQKILS